MPEIRCLFARSTPEVDRALLAESSFAGEVYVIPAMDAGFIAKPDDRLTVVRLPDPPQGSTIGSLTKPDARAMVGGAALARFHWLRWVLPTVELAGRLTTIARTTSAPLVWFYWHERGDDLYNDMALAFRPAGRRLYARQTFLGGDNEDAAAFDLDSGDRAAQVWNDSPLQAAMARLGLVTWTQYFVPEDSARFDWDRYRLVRT